MRPKKKKQTTKKKAAKKRAAKKQAAKKKAWREKDARYNAAREKAREAAREKACEADRKREAKEMVAKEKAKKAAEKNAKRTFCGTCPHCGFSEANGATSERLFGGPRFGEHIVGLAAIVTRIRASDITGKPRGPRFSHARTSVMLAMRSIAVDADATASWDLCGDAIKRDKGSSHKLYNTWRDDPVAIKNALAIVEKYKAAA